VTDPAPEQSFTVTPLKMLGTAAWQFALAVALVAAGQVRVGGVLSKTVKVVVQVALLPAASVAVTVIVCGPTPTIVPAAGDWDRVIAPAALQVSLTLTPLSTLGTAAWQLAPALAVEAAGQATIGGVLSVTVKVVVQVALLPVESVAVTVIVCAPNPTTVPAAGDWLRVMLSAPAQPPLTVTPLKTFGTAAWQLASALALVGAGQFMVSVALPITVKVVVQVALLPAASVAVTVIVCAPNPTTVPAAGD